MSRKTDPILVPYPPAEFLRYVELFNAGDYFEAHEVLEDLWVMTTGEERAFYKGLIMLAVGLLHAQRGNKRGAKGVLEGALAHLADYPPLHGGLDRAEAVALGQGILDGKRMPKVMPRMGLVGA